MSIAEVQVEAEIETFADKDPWYSVALDLIKRKPLGAAGAFIVLIMILMALFAELIAPFDPELNSYEYMLVGPDWTFLLGTDQFGRDIFSRIVYGARTALFVGFVSAFVGSAIGLVLGVTSAYFGGKFDLVFQRVMDVFMSFPLIILALAVVSIFGTTSIYMYPRVRPPRTVLRQGSPWPVRSIPWLNKSRSSPIWR